MCGFVERRKGGSLFRGIVQVHSPEQTVLDQVKARDQCGRMDVVCLFAEFDRYPARSSLFVKGKQTSKGRLLERNKESE